MTIRLLGALLFQEGELVFSKGADFVNLPQKHRITFIQLLPNSLITSSLKLKLNLKKPLPTKPHPK